MADATLRRAPELPRAEWLRPLPCAARFAFYGGAPARAAAAPVWGCEFSEAACRAVAHRTRATLWLGPDEYLLLDFQGAATPPGALLTDLETALIGHPHALVDIGHRQFAFEVHGPQAAGILNGACPLDLDISEFPVGMCTRTVLAKADIVLWRTAAEVFHVEAWRSFAGYVSGLLVQIAAGL